MKSFSAPANLLRPDLFCFVLFSVKAWLLQALMLQGGKSNKQLLFPVQMFQFQSHCWGEKREEELIISKASSQSGEMLEVANPFTAFPLCSLPWDALNLARKTRLPKC